MKRTLTLLFALLALGTIALAASLPNSGTVTVKNDSGTQVGTGTISNGQLSLSLDTGTSGFVTITVTDAKGSTQTFEAMVKAGGKVTVVDGSQFSNLPDFAKSGGVDSVDVTENSDNHASSTGQQEKQDNAADPSQKEQSSQAGDHSQGNGQVSGSKQPGKDDSAGSAGSSSSSAGSSSSSEGSSSAGAGSADSSPDTSASNETKASAGDDQVKVGTNLNDSTKTGSGSTSTDTSASGTASTDD